MDPVLDRGSMDPVHESGPWTQSKVGVHGPLVHVLSSPGKEPFRKWCGLVSEIRSFLRKQVPLTATASPLTRDKIIKSLSLKKCLEISVSPNRENIKLFVLKVTSEISVNFTWLARKLQKENCMSAAINICPRL